MGCMPGFLPRRKYVSTECVQRILPPLYAREPSHCKGLRAFEYVSTVHIIKNIKYKIYHYKFAIYHALNILTHTTRAAGGRRGGNGRPYSAVHHRPWCRGALYMRPGRRLRNDGCHGRIFNPPLQGAVRRGRCPHRPDREAAWQKRRHEGMPPYGAGRIFSRQLPFNRL